PEIVGFEHLEPEPERRALVPDPADEDLARHEERPDGKILETAEVVAAADVAGERAGPALPRLLRRGDGALVLSAERRRHAEADDLRREPGDRALPPRVVSPVVAAPVAERRERAPEFGVRRRRRRPPARRPRAPRRAFVAADVRQRDPRASTAQRA